MLTSAAVLAVIEGALAGYAIAMHRRQPFEGGTLFTLCAGLALAALSLSMIAAAALIEVPESRGVFVVAALVGLGWLAVRRLRRGPRIGPLHAETEAAPQPAPRPVKPDVSRYHVRGVGEVRPVPAPAAGAPRSARVRRIMSMEDNYGD